MIARWSLLLLAGLLLLGTSPSQAGGIQPLTLEEALVLALEQNRDIQKAREYKRWVEGRYVEERSSAFPQLTLSAYTAIQRDESAIPAGGGADNITVHGMEVGLAQPLFTWGKVSAAIRAAKEGLLQADEQLRLYRQSVGRSVATAYLDALMAREMEAIARQNLTQKESRLTEARRKQEAGLATDYDVLAAEVSVDHARPELIRSQNQIRITRDRLAFLLALPGPLDVTGPLEPADGLAGRPILTGEEAYAAALSNRPELRDLSHRIAIAAEILTIESAANKPRLDLKGAYGNRWVDYGPLSLDGPAWNVGVYLTFPFFDGLRTQGRVAQSESDLRSLTLDREKLKEAIRLEIQDALNALREADEILRAASRSVTQAERLLFLTEKGLELGVKIRLDVEDAELKLLQARVARARAWRDYRTARVNLLWAMGQLGEPAYE